MSDIILCQSFVARAGPVLVIARISADIGHISGKTFPRIIGDTELPAQTKTWDQDCTFHSVWELFVRTSQYILGFSMSLFNLRMTVSCDRGTKGWVGSGGHYSGHCPQVGSEKNCPGPAPGPGERREPLPVPGQRLSFVTQLTQNDRWQ